MDMMPLLRTRSKSNRFAGALFATLAVLAAAPAWAQYADDRAPRPRRNDAYQPSDTGPGLGTLNGPATGSGYSNPYANGTVAQAAPNDGYTPRYGDPVRPYEAPPPVFNGPYNGNGTNNGYPGGNAGASGDAYRPPAGGYGQNYPAPADDRRYDDRRADDRRTDDRRFEDRGDNRDNRYDDRGPGPRDGRNDGTYSSNDIVSAGGNFFGAASQGLAQMIETLFKRQGRPNGYILGEEGGGAFVAGLRYGEGTLYTRDAGSRKVYWQGPSLGYDFGGAGSKTMILVYNLHSVNEIYERFGGVDGSAYFIGGLGMTLLTREHITLAPIRTGIGLRLGANVGYLKFTPRATWNPF